jgi:hypothetical protein
VVARAHESVLAAGSVLMVAIALVAARFATVGFLRDWPASSGVIAWRGG